MYTSSSQGHAIHSIRWLKNQIEHNKLLAPFRLRPGNKWTDEWIQVFHGVEEIPINVFAVGVTGQIRGFNLDDYRPDLLVGDDILDEENVATKEQRQKVEDRWFGGLMNSLAPPSEAPLAKAVLGQTPFNLFDLSIKCMRDSSWNTRVYGCFDETGKSRWEARFSTEWLKKEREAYIARGQYALWKREMECEVVVAEDKPFDIEKMQYWDVLPDDMRKVVAIDPASADSPKADFNVVMCVGVKGPDYYVCAYDRSRGVDPGKAAAKFFEIVLNHAPILQAGVEGVAYQRTLKWHIEQEMTKRKLWVPMRLLDAVGRKANRILAAIPGLLHYGHLRIHRSMVELLEELNFFNPEDKDNRDDLLDALSMALVMLNPALRTIYGDAIEGEFTVMDDSEFKELAFGGCP
jgi:hypothetical protein